MFVVPNLTLLIQDIAFFLLLFLIARYLYRPIVQVLEARTKRIQDGLRAADEARKDREASQQEREKAVQDLREQVADLAVLAASRIIGESLDAKKHRELIERAIEEAKIRA